MRVVAIPTDDVVLSRRVGLTDADQVVAVLEDGKGSVTVSPDEVEPIA